MQRKTDLRILAVGPTTRGDQTWERCFNPDGSVCPERVRSQFVGLYTSLSGVELVMHEGAGDAVFAQDPWTPIYTPNGTGRPRVMLNRMGVESRSGEAEARLGTLRRFFREDEILRMPEGAMHEGGDVIIAWSNEHHCWVYFVGRPCKSKGRTNQAGRDALRVAVEANGNRFEEVDFNACSASGGALHLSTCCGFAGPNSDGVLHVIAGQNQLLDTSPFEAHGIKVLWAPRGEEWGSNVLRLPIQDAPLNVQSGYDGVVRVLMDNGYDNVPMSILNWDEVRKIDGSLTCALCVLQVAG